MNGDRGFRALSQYNLSYALNDFFSFEGGGDLLFFTLNEEILTALFHMGKNH